MRAFRSCAMFALLEPGYVAIAGVEDLAWDERVAAAMGSGIRPAAVVTGEPGGHLCDHRARSTSQGEGLVVA
jgi:hypothetical protein